MAPLIVSGVTTSLKHRLAALAALVTVALTAGCGLESVTINGGSPTAPPTADAPTADAGQAKNSVPDSGDLPDPCTLLSRSQVQALTGREITQVDEDGAEPGATTRYCQWQQNGGQLALLLSRTTDEGFRTTVAEAEPVDGVGEDAYAFAGHLYVLYGTVQVDVYSRGASDERNLADAKQVAGVVIPKI